MNSKAWWRSKTLWLNAAALVLAVLALPEFISVIPSAWLPIIGSVAAALNLLLRTLGGAPLSITKPPR